MTTPPDLLAAALARDPAQPAITFYDDATGERVELSWATLDNWVAKTANMLVDGLAVEPGDPVGLLLPAHWQTAAVLFGCWSAGAVPLLSGADATSASVVIAAADELPAALELRAPDTLGLSLRPLGAPLTEVPPGVQDYGVEVRGYADTFRPLGPPDAAAPALRFTDATAVSGGELAALATARATEQGLTPDDRVLITADWGGLDGLLDGLLAPVAAGAGMVLCRHQDPALLEARLATERVTRR